MTEPNMEKVVHCGFCGSEIPATARVCRHCHRNLRSAPSFQTLLALAALVISLLSLYESFTKASHDKNLANLQVVMATLRELQAMQRDLELVVKKTAQGQNLSTQEIYLLNYYQLLTRTLAENKDYAPFGKARCTYAGSVRVRERPSVRASQVGGVRSGEEVRVLGTFTYAEGETWFYVITSDNKVGWAYKYFSPIEQSEMAQR
jgi:hypothetical protein